MGYILIRPRDPKKPMGFRGLSFPFPWADQAISIYEEMGGSEEARIEIVRRKDVKTVGVSVYEPPDGEDGDETTP